VDSKYTLILSRGEHGISEKDADRLSMAIEQHQPYIDLDLDYFGDGSSMRAARIITAQVIMIIENVKETPTVRNELTALLSGKVSRIRGR